MCACVCVCGKVPPRAAAATATTPKCFYVSLLCSALSGVSPSLRVPYRRTRRLRSLSHAQAYTCTQGWCTRVRLCARIFVFSLISLYFGFLLFFIVFFFVVVPVTRDGPFADGPLGIAASPSRGVASCAHARSHARISRGKQRKRHREVVGGGGARTHTRPHPSLHLSISHIHTHPWAYAHLETHVFFPPCILVYHRQPQRIRIVCHACCVL